MPDIGCHQFDETISVETIVREISILADCLPVAHLKHEVENLLRASLPKLQLESFNDTTINQRGYGRKLLYSHPGGQFSALQLIWKPGAITPIHGHNAWGVVGVVSGTIGCETFTRSEEQACGASRDQPATSSPPPVLPRGAIRASTGAIASVNPDPEGIHRLYNPTDDTATTLHIYGMDLSPNPCAINVPYEKGSHTQATTA